jgi:GTP-binding protein
VEIKSATFRCSALRAADRPGEPFPQVAVAGRSNVGKSSLLNWLLRRSVARVGKAPGKTRTLNFFLVNRSWYLVDLPGYGYAKVKQQLREEWGRELSRYLLGDDRLAAVICLVDVRHGLTPRDGELHELLLAAGCERIVVLTKADKVGRGQRLSMQRHVQAHLGLPVPPVAVSVRSGEGRRELLAAVDGALGAWRERQRGA